jgi:hypothetical protein
MPLSSQIADRHPRITFGIIVLNGEPFTRYCLRQLYPHAHQIVVVEGGSRKAASFAKDGHSTDGTLEALENFKREEDPDGKVTIITRDGFWSEKDEQSQAYAEVATGEYLWQVDIDEFYTHSDIERTRSYLRSHPGVSAVSFRQRPFFGSPQYWVDSYRLRAENKSEYHRLFRWDDGYRYVTHRPPTVVDADGIDLREKNWLSAVQTEKLGLRLYHYSLLFPKQVREKCAYYNDPGDDPSKAHAPGIVKWAKECYFELKHPFRVHNVFISISWLRRHEGVYPEQIQQMWGDVESGALDVDVRRHDDIEALFSRRSYLLAGLVLTWWSNLFRLPGPRFLSRTFFWVYRRSAGFIDRVLRTLSSGDQR